MTVADPQAPQDVIRRLNEAWRAGRPDDLAAFFHQEAVIVDGSHRIVAEGRQACVESYRAFISSATIEAYQEGAPEVRLLGPAALVSYPFEITYRTGGQSYHESGSDAFLLVRQAAGWTVAWRQLIWGAV